MLDGSLGARSAKLAGRSPNVCEAENSKAERDLSPTEDQSESDANPTGSCSFTRTGSTGLSWWTGFFSVAIADPARLVARCGGAERKEEDGLESPLLVELVESLWPIVQEASG